MTTIPSIPPYIDTISSDAAAKNILPRLWSMNAHPEFPYLPESIRYEGPLFERLAFTSQRVPIKQAKGGWALCPEVQSQWHSLEQLLEFVTVTLLSSGAPAMPLDFEFMDLPSSFGYSQIHKEERYARRCAMNSRNAFIPLMAMCSFAISLNFKSINNPSPPWIEYLADRGVHHEWAQWLNDSSVADFTENNRRRGVLLHVGRCRWIHFVPAMLDAHIPIWYYWGVESSNPFKPQFELNVITQHCPSKRAIEAARLPSVLALRPEASFSNSRSSPQDPQQPHSSLPDRPPPNPAKNSGQRRGESWQQYFGRLDEAHSQTRAAETDDPLDRRLSCEQTQRSWVPWSDHGHDRNPRVFVWEKVHGFRIRKSVSRKTAIDVWGYYTDSQRRHNSFANEWDLCSEFDPQGTPIGDEDDEDEDSSMGPRQDDDCSPPRSHPPSSRSHPSSSLPPPPSTSYLPPPSPSHPIRSEASTLPAPVSTLSGLPQSLPPRQRPRPPPSASSLPPPPSTSRLPPSPSHPLSFSHPIHPEALLQSLPPRQRPRPPLSAWRDDILSVFDYKTPSSANALELDDLAEKLFYRFGYNLDESPYIGTGRETVNRLPWKEIRRIFGDQESQYDTACQDPVVDFVACLLQSWDGLTNLGVPGKYWDLSDTNSAALCNERDRLIDVATERWCGEDLYVIKPRNLHPSRDTSWRLVLRDAAAVLECLRQRWGPHSEDIAHHLLKRGIPFSTYIRSSIASRPTSNRPEVSLGYRPPKYKPDIADYVAYEAARDTLLSQPHGRAALLKGGIVWRLAMETLRDHVALMGPSQDAFSSGCSMVSPRGNVYVDDDLYQDEMDLICGVYKVYTGQSKQASHSSWWPKQSTWETEACGFNIGYWSRDCETWFQNRLKAIRGGTADLKTALWVAFHVLRRCESWKGGA